MSNNTPSGSARRTRLQVFLAILLVSGLLMTCLFGLRAARAFHRIQRPGLHKPERPDIETIRGWMTVPFIAHTYGVPEDYLFDSIGIPPDGNRRESLKELNLRFAPAEPDLFVSKVKAAIEEYDLTHEPPDPPAGPPPPAPGRSFP